MIVSVTFEGNRKIYRYNTNIQLLEDGVYDIMVDNSTTYDNFVTIQDIKEGHDRQLRTITYAWLIKGPRKPDKLYKNIYVNKAKRTICVVWRDGSKTVMKCHPDDEWDEEKGIALCFMKRVFNNRGCYYDTFRDVIHMED